MARWHGSACLHCGQVFRHLVATGRIPHFCSENCRAAAKRQGLPDSASCPTCSATFRPGRPAGIVQVYCSRLCNPKYGWSCTSCGVVRDAGGRGRAQTPADKYVCHPCRKEQPRRKAGNPCSICGKPKAVGAKGELPCRKCSGVGSRKPRPCEICSNNYKPTYTLQRTCGRTCGSVLKDQQKPPRPAPASKVNWLECKDCGSPYTSRTRRRCGCDAPRTRVFITDCRVCTRCFVSPYTNSTCSDECADRKRRQDRRLSKDKRRALKRDAYRADVSPAKIYARDGYRCKLCGKKLNMKVVVPHPKAPTIDHIVPLAQGGLHEPRNAQAAHFICNSIKSDRGGNEQLLLIG